MPRAASLDRFGLLLVATCWLAAGPGAVVLRAVAECRHQQHAHHQQHQHGTPIPDGVPCFCGEMALGSGLTLPAVLPDLTAPAALISATVSAVPFPLPPTPFLSFSPVLEPPPPNPLA